MEEKRIKMQQRDKKLAETLFPFKVRMGLEVPLSYTANTSLDKKVRFKESKSPKKKPTTERPVYEWQHLKKKDEKDFERTDFRLERYRFEGRMWKEELRERLST